jgi:hypothetical protein
MIHICGLKDIEVLDLAIHSERVVPILIYIILFLSTDRYMRSLCIFRELHVNFILSQKIPNHGYVWDDRL